MFFENSCQNFINVNKYNYKNFIKGTIRDYLCLGQI